MVLPRRLWTQPGDASPDGHAFQLGWSLPECGLGAGARARLGLGLGLGRGAQARGEPYARTPGLPFREAGGHTHTAAGNEQDSGASASAGPDTTNTRHSEPDVANRPQISARQRPGCGERLLRSLACARCRMRVTCVRGRGQGSGRQSQRAPPSPTGAQALCPQTADTMNSSPAEHQQGLETTCVPVSASRARLQGGGQGQSHRTGSHELSCR